MTVMCKKLYYLDSIHLPMGEPENRTEFKSAQVLLLGLDQEKNIHNDENVNEKDYNDLGVESQIVEISQEGLFFADGNPVMENSYVYYDSERKKFSRGGSHPYARAQVAINNVYRRSIILRSRENDEERLNLEQYQGSNTQVFTYHVNVGHGNCSIGVIQKGSSIMIWMVDCGGRGLKNGISRNGNIDDCFKYVKKKFGLTKIHVDCFMLTHFHSDHYNGIEYLMNMGYIDSKTVFGINMYYSAASLLMNRILGKIKNNRNVVIEPKIGAKALPTRILFPEIRIIKNMTSSSMCSASKCRVESNANNASVIYCMNFAGKTMVFTGDMEQGEQQLMTGGCFCCAELCRTNYYCIAHHGSLNGHVKNSCMYPCVMHNLEYAILMGRDKAYPGIYSSQVIDDFPNLLLYTEKDNNGKPIQFFELDWNNNKVTYY